MIAEKARARLGPAFGSRDQRRFSGKIAPPRETGVTGKLSKRDLRDIDAAQTQLDGHDLAGDCRGRHGALDRGLAARRGGAAWAASAARRRYFHRRSLSGAGW